MRQWIQEHSGVVVGVCVVAVAAVLVWRLTSGADDGPAPEGEAWYYDVVRGEAFTGDAEQFAPITSPWGQRGGRGVLGQLRVVLGGRAVPGVLSEVQRRGEGADQGGPVAERGGAWRVV